ncbi:hypothetical protein FDP41_009313 [Naegleria fowleri]|uniref:YrhK domain-containing protein n=1 Tax=Naegleria fowleri TaxID=5763 RepID=A0A6A5BEB0_NAEFO|nr:uncharacterized protein FDP41_009313 [Naegleria fowleri]KAF0972410.1 hypothetical protein FDP41_009313 [Naegleria fowleri]
MMNKSTPENAENSYNHSLSNSDTKIDNSVHDHVGGERYPTTPSSSYDGYHASSRNHLDLYNGSIHPQDDVIMQPTVPPSVALQTQSSHSTIISTTPETPLSTPSPNSTALPKSESKLQSGSPQRLCDVDIAATTTTGSSAKRKLKDQSKTTTTTTTTARASSLSHRDANICDLSSAIPGLKHNLHHPSHPNDDPISLPYLNSCHSINSSSTCFAELRHLPSNFAHSQLGVKPFSSSSELIEIHHHPHNDHGRGDEATAPFQPIVVTTPVLVPSKIHEALQSQKNNLLLGHAMRIAISLAFAWMDLNFVLGAALFVAGCGLLIASNEVYFFSGVLLFIIGSAFFLVGPVGKLLIDLYQLVRHVRWETKLKHLPTLYNVTEVVDVNHLHHYDSDHNNSSKSSSEFGQGRVVDQLVDLQHEFRKYRPDDLPSLKLILLELFNDALLLLGGLTFTIGSSLYMLNPPMLIVYIAEACWAIGAISYLIVTINQYALKQMEIIKNHSKSYEVTTCKCFTLMTLDIASYLFNILSSVLFVIGAGCFLVNQRSLEITGEVIWSGGCISMIIAITFARIIWLKNTFCSSKTV